jgi:Zn finger protein HypA/HybF involved in hydrogenase expression
MPWFRKKKGKIEPVRDSERVVRTENVFVRCDECGQTSRFTAKDRGSVQECPHCGEYVDVGKSDDFETPDDTAAEKNDDDAE